MSDFYLDASKESGKAFITQKIPEEVTMLNLLRFRAVADYSNHPELAPEEPITGKEAFQKYIKHISPFLNEAGGEVLFQGSCNTFLIGPPEEKWDWVILVRYTSRKSFLSLSSNQDFLSGYGHRLAALSDSRLLPIVEESFNT